MTVEVTDEVKDLSVQLAGLSAGERIRALADRFPGQILASTSFGLQAAVMLKLIKEYAPEIPVIFIDT